MGSTSLKSNWSHAPLIRDIPAPAKSKRKQKTVEELIGIPKSKKGGKNKRKCVVFRSAIVAAALSVSSDGIRNRNRILLNEEEVAWTISKIIGEDYLGNDEEVISKIMISDGIEAEPLHNNHQ